jgi:hypothetical protein
MESQNTTWRGVVTNQQLHQTSANLYVIGGGIPATVRSQDKTVVAISGEELSKALAVFYSAGIRHVEVDVLVNDLKVILTGTIYKRNDRRTGRTHYIIYPLGSGQKFLREKYRAFRGEVPRNLKRPMPILVMNIRPKTT